MGYFGGLGAGKGWLKCLFLVEPELLRELLAATKPVLVITNGRVPADYAETSHADYIEAYGRYVEAMLESPQAARKAAMQVYMGLAASLEPFTATLLPDRKFKLLISDEPTANLAPESVYFDAHRGQFCTNVMSDLYLGVQLSFPRVISLDQEGHELLHDTSAFPTRGIFDELKSRIQKATVPCKVRSPAREHRTPIRITHNMRQRMKDHPGLKLAQLQVL